MPDHDTSTARRVIVDTDTAGDDTQALMLAATSSRLILDGVTIAAGNVAFDAQVENAKYTLQLADSSATVYEGARRPLVKTHAHAEEVHGEDGLGGHAFVETGIPSGRRHAATYLVDRARQHPGKMTLACIAPLTNIALALQLEPRLGELLDEVLIMGGNVNCLGNVTPSAEYNFWVDPDAARIVLDSLDVVLFDWGLTVRDTGFGAETLARIETDPKTDRSRFYQQVTRHERVSNRQLWGREVTMHPDSALIAALMEPGLIEQTAQWHVQVDNREGLTRGYSAVDELGVTQGEARTQVVTSLDTQRFRTIMLDMLLSGSVRS
ncbi:MAG: nucleoside hydrolase [Candidatus Bipolaricaulia bacterium]